MAEPRKRRFSMTPGGILSGSILLLLLLMVMAAWARNRSLRGKIADEIEAIRARGEPVTIAELKRAYESVPEEENAAPILLDAFGLLKTNWPKPVEAFASVRAPSGEKALSEEEMALARAFMETNAPALELLDQALERPYATFSMEWYFDMLLPHLPPIKQLAQLLALRARVVAVNAPEQAVEDVQRITALSGLLEREATAISYLVRVALLHGACSSIEYLLNSPAELQVTHLRRLSESLPEALDLQPVLMTERVLGLQLIRPMTHSVGEADPELNSLGLSSTEGRVLSVSGFLLRDHLKYLEQMALIIQIATHDFPDSLSGVAGLERELDAKQEETTETLQNFKLHKIGSTTFFTWSQVSSLAKIFERTAMILAQIRMTRLALLLEEHRIRTGEYPVDLGVFDGKIPEAERIDPFTGSPLRYVPGEDSFTLYSLGMDKTDQGGARRSTERSKRDEPFDLPFNVNRQ